METPVLNKKQKKSSLSAKKNRPKETIKNVLATPFNNNFWPQMSPEDNILMTKILKANLPRIKEDKVNVPWNDLKNIAKTDRKSFRTDYTKKVTGQEINKDECTGLSLGVNNVTKQLENNSASAVMITSDVLPRIMVQHLIDMSVLYKIPILAVDNLRSVLKTQCGISSVAAAIHKNIQSGSKLNLIKDFVHEIFTKCPVPENHINYKRSLNSHITANPPPKISDNEPKIEVDEEIIRQTLHLKRQNKHSRTFVPNFSTNNKKIAKLEVDESGFLAFSDEPVVEEKPPQHYKSLIVKRLKGDKNRNKRKMRSLKEIMCRNQKV